MRKIFIPLLFLVFMTSNLYAYQSTIIESEGYACMGKDRTRKQTETAAMADAKRKAIEQALTYIQSETHVKDLELQKDLISAYANGAVDVIRQIQGDWYNDASAGDCYRVKIKAEVIPDEKMMEKILTANKKTGFLSDAKAAFPFVWGSFDYLPGVNINESFIEVIGEGLQNNLNSDKEKEKSAVVSAMVMSLRKFAENTLDLKNFIANYEAAEKKGDKKFIEENKEFYRKAKLYADLFKKFKGDSSFESVKDFGLIKSYLYYDFGEFTLKSRTLIREYRCEYDIVTLTFKDGRKQITVRTAELVEPGDIKYYDKLWRILIKMGFQGNFRYSRDKETVAFILKYTRRP